MTTATSNIGLNGFETPTTSRAALWTSRVLGGFALAFLTVDWAMKVFESELSIKATTELGFQASHVFVIGVIELVCCILVVIPRTSVVGAVMLTGYLGGAVATHFRLDNPLASHTLFPVYVAAMVWGSLLLRDTRLRAFLPFRTRD